MVRLCLGLATTGGQQKRCAVCQSLRPAAKRRAAEGLAAPAGANQLLTERHFARLNGHPAESRAPPRSLLVVRTWRYIAKRGNTGQKSEKRRGVSPRRNPLTSGCGFSKALEQ